VGVGGARDHTGNGCADAVICLGKRVGVGCGVKIGTWYSVGGLHDLNCNCHMYFFCDGVCELGWGGSLVPRTYNTCV